MPRSRWVTLATLVLLVHAAAVAGRLAWREGRRIGQRPHDGPAGAEVAARWRALAAALPPGGVVGFLGTPRPTSGSAHADALQHHELQQLQYELAPRLVVEGAEPEVVIVLREDAPRARAAAEAHGLRVVSDLGDGLLVAARAGAPEPPGASGPEDPRGQRARGPMTAALGAAAPLLLGLALAWLLAPPARRPAPALLTGALALPLGLGAASILRFLWLLGPGPTASGFVAAELALAAALLGVAAWRRPRGEPEPPRADEPRAPRWAVGLSAVVVVLALLGQVAFAATHPHGRWDAWMIWNFRARFLLRADEGWRDAFSPLLPWSHPDYPLGLPLTIEALWRALGDESVVVPIAVALGYTLATAGVLAGAAALARGPWVVPAVLALLLGSGEVLKQGASQYADVPLGCLFLASLVGLALHARAPGPRGERWLLLAGAAAGLAAWTKNEGLLFALALPAGLLVSGRGRGARGLARGLLCLVVGAAPALLVLAWFKLALAPSNDLVAGQGPGVTLGRVVDPARWLTILRWLAVEGIKLPVYLLAAYLAIVGLARDARRDPALRGVVAVLALLGLGYFAVYLVTPLPLEWHLDTSLTRLLVQLWPSAVWAGALAARAPADANGEALSAVSRPLSE